MHVKQFVEQAGRSLVRYGRIYLQQYCDTGAYRAIPMEKEAYDIGQRFYQPDVMKGEVWTEKYCWQHPNVWFELQSNYSRCVLHTYASMADGAFDCACREHVTPGTIPPPSICEWLRLFNRDCFKCPGASPGRRLAAAAAAAAAINSSTSSYRQHGSIQSKGLNSSINLALQQQQQQQQRRHLSSLLPVLPMLPDGSKCRDYSPERLCAAQRETWNKYPLYMVYTMWSVCE
jgi:hypothetical protein